LVKIRKESMALALGSAIGSWKDPLIRIFLLYDKTHLMQQFHKY